MKSNSFCPKRPQTSFGMEACPQCQSVSELPASAAGTNVAFLLHCRSSLAAILAMRSSASRYESLINLSNLIRVGKAGILTAQGWEIFTHLTGSTTEVCMKFVYKTSGYKTKSLIRQIGNGLIKSIVGKHGAICKTDALIR